MVSSGRSRFGRWPAHGSATWRALGIVAARCSAILVNHSKSWAPENTRVGWDSVREIELRPRRLRRVGQLVGGELDVEGTPLHRADEVDGRGVGAPARARSTR